MTPSAPRTGPSRRCRLRDCERRFSNANFTVRHENFMKAKATFTGILEPGGLLLSANGRAGLEAMGVQLVVGQAWAKSARQVIVRRGAG